MAGLTYGQKTDAMISAIQDIIDDMPEGLWEHFINMMYIPFLKRLVHADHRGILPAKWMVTLPVRRPPRSLRQNFYDLCKVLQTDRNTHGKECRDILNALHQPAYDLLHSMLNKNPKMLESRDAFMGLTAQLQMINGSYSTYKFVKNYLEDFEGVDFLVGYVVKSGGTEFVLEVCRGFLNDISTDRPKHGAVLVSNALINTPKTHALLALIEGLENHIKTQQDRKIAVAMALHGRLGGGSALGSLGADLLSSMIPADPPRQVLWHDVTADFFQRKYK